MVAPITGPFLYTVSQVYPYPGETRLSFYRRQEKMRQKRPYDLSLKYELYLGQILARGSDRTDVSSWFIPMTRDNSASIVAYERFKANAYEQAELGVAIAERRQAVDMVWRRTVQLTNFVRQVARGNLGGAARALGIPRADPRIPRQASRSAANTYLEFHFGWSPLVGDIYRAIDILQRNAAPMRATGSGDSTGRYVSHPGGSYVVWRDSEFRCVVRYGAQIEVWNPNLHLANQLGLVNPAVIAWELVPFSFVLDWFVNVSDFFGSGTDFLGLNLVNPYTTFFNKGVVRNTFWITPGVEIYQDYWSRHVQVRSSRAQGIDKPSLGLRPARLWGWRRTFAACSLLIQQMGRL